MLAVSKNVKHAGCLEKASSHVCWQCQKMLNMLVVLKMLPHMCVGSVNKMLNMLVVLKRLPHMCVGSVNKMLNMLVVLKRLVLTLSIKC